MSDPQIIFRLYNQKLQEVGHITVETGNNMALVFTAYYFVVDERGQNLFNSWQASHTSSSYKEIVDATSKFSDVEKIAPA